MVCGKSYQCPILNKCFISHNAQFTFSKPILLLQLRKAVLCFVMLILLNFVKKAIPVILILGKSRSFAK